MMVVLNLNIASNNISKPRKKNFTRFDCVLGSFFEFFNLIN